MNIRSVLKVITIVCFLFQTLVFAREIDEGKSTEIEEIEDDKPARWDKALCHYQPETGNCKAYIRSYYYNIQKHECVEFVYGGCQGNPNRFSSKKRCMQKCGGLEDLNLPVAVVNSFVPTCHLQAEPGPCLADMSMYYYDINTETCKTFTYGGCRGNANKFIDEESCLTQCAGQH